jgi:hypothetical protein
MAAHFGARQGLLIFGLAVVIIAIVLTQWWVRDTLPWAQAEAAKHAPGITQTHRPRYPTNISSTPTTAEVFTLMSWRDKRLMALSQAGLVEKFVDALVWILYPVFLYQKGVSLTNVGWIISFYGFTWGGSQLITGRLSDRIGRHIMNVSGMWICGAGVAAMMLVEGTVWWATSAAYIRISLLRSRISRTRRGAAPRSGSIVSGVIWVTGSVHWGLALPRTSVVRYKPLFGLSLLRWASQVHCFGGWERKHTHASTRCCRTQARNERMTRYETFITRLESTLPSVNP